MATANRDIMIAMGNLLSVIGLAQAEAAYKEAVELRVSKNVGCT